MQSRAAILRQTADLAANFLDTLPDRDVRNIDVSADAILRWAAMGARPAASAVSPGAN